MVSHSTRPQPTQPADSERALRRIANITREILDFAYATYSDKLMERDANTPPPPIPHNHPALFVAADTTCEVRGAFSGRCSQQVLQAAIDEWVDLMFPVFTYPYKYMVKYSTRRSGRIFDLNYEPSIDEYDDFEP
jgi:hypothetical protein